MLAFSKELVWKHYSLVWRHWRPFFILFFLLSFNWYIASFYISVMIHFQLFLSFPNELFFSCCIIYCGFMFSAALGTDIYRFFQWEYGGCIPNAYNANKRTWDMSSTTDWWLLFLLHENQQCLHCDCCQQQC